MEGIFQTLSTPTLWIMNSDPFVGYTILGVLLCIALIMAGLALAKMRLSPLWVLLLLVPFVAPLSFWVLAYIKWPVDKTNA